MAYLSCKSPLNWPVSWKRSVYRYKPHFGEYSMDRVLHDLETQIRLTEKMSNAIVTCNGRMNRSLGWFLSNQPQPEDRGVALYFFVGKDERVLACDRWNRIEDNIWAIKRHIGALRQQERDAVGSIEQAFAGYTALPAPGQTHAPAWWNVLGVAHDAPFEVLKEVYLEKAKASHPDNGGSHESMVALNAAWDMARKHYNR